MTFQKGQSGNPAGRKPGTKVRRTQFARFLDAEPQLQAKVIELALAGDSTAIRVVADRLWPRARPEMKPVHADDVADEVSLSDRAHALIDKGLRGELPADVLRQLIEALVGQARISEMDELEKRLRTLEESSGNAPAWMKEPKARTYEDDDDDVPIRPRPLTKRRKQ